MISTTPPVALSNRAALHEFLGFSLPFVVSRLFTAASWFAEGYVLRGFGQEAILAGPSINVAKSIVMGVAQGFMLTGNLTGRLITEGKHHEVAHISRQSWLTAVPLSLVSGLCLYFLAPILTLSQIDLDDRSKGAITAYFRYYIISLLPTAWAISDRSLLMANKKQTQMTAFSFIFTALTIAIGYPLALHTELGIAGLGLGLAISSVLNALTLRLYIYHQLPNQDFLQNKQLPNLSSEIKTLLKNGVGSSLSILTEQANLAIIAAFAASINSEALDATQVSTQWILPYGFLMYAFGQAGSVLISRKLGALAKAAYGDKEIHQQNIRKIGYTSAAFNVSLGAIAATLIACLAKPFANLFIPEATHTATTLLLINCLGTPIDAARAAFSCNLSGFKDLMTPPIISVACMSLLGLSVSAAMIYGEKAGAEWLFIPRVAGIFIAAIAIGWRWEQKSCFDETKARLLIN